MCPGTMHEVGQLQHKDGTKNKTCLKSTGLGLFIENTEVHPGRHKPERERGKETKPAKDPLKVRLKI